MKLILLLLLIVVFSSCTDYPRYYRAKQLEDNTINIIHTQFIGYKVGDSVWVDSTNTINPQANNAMLCVILDNN